MYPSSCHRRSVLPVTPRNLAAWCAPRFFCCLPVDGGDATGDVFTVWLDGVGATTVSVVRGATVSVVEGVDKISVIIKIKVADGVEKC